MRRYDIAGLSIDIELVTNIEILTLQMRDDARQHVGRVKHVAGVHKIAVLTPRQCNALVHGVVYTPVRLTYQVGDMGRILVQQVDASVGRSAINDDKFKVGTSLRGDRIQGAGVALAIVPTDSDYTDFRRGHDHAC